LRAAMMGFCCVSMRRAKSLGILNVWGAEYDVRIYICFFVEFIYGLVLCIYMIFVYYGLLLRLHEETKSLGTLLVCGTKCGVHVYKIFKHFVASP
jgi:ABC-type amino acid transport system permease subunit